MMEPAFTIDLDRQHDMLLITLSGFFGESDVARLGAARAEAHRTLGCAANAHVTLVDAAAFKIQPQTVVDAFSQVVRAPAYRARRLAFVTGGSLARMQVRRIAEGVPDVVCFDERTAAIAWLLSAEANRSAA